MLSLITFLAILQSATKPEPPPGGICLDAEEKATVVRAVKELQDIKDSPAVLKFKQPIEIIQDWQGRVYVNGGTTKPIVVQIKIGDTVDRDVALTLPTHVYYRPEPPDPMFRLRIRAQAGILVPQVFQNEAKIYEGLDGSIGVDFFHIDWFNVAIAPGIRSLTGNLGFDLTKNFGLYGGAGFVYSEFKATGIFGAYFSF